jgi:hypothetical protein
MDPDPGIFVGGLHDGNKKKNFVVFLLNTFSKIKRHKKVTKQ